MMNSEEAMYLKGPNPPVTSSVLTSSSRFLNNPVYRDLYAQMGLKKDAHDLPDTYLIPEIINIHSQMDEGNASVTALEAEKKRLPEFADWLDARFWSTFSVDSIVGHEPGTLGYNVHEFMSKSGMDIDFMYKEDPKTDYDYMEKRRVQTHDIEHMVTGLDPSPVGEIGLIAYNLTLNTNYFSKEFAGELNRLNGFLLSTSLMRSNLHFPHMLGAYLEAIARAHTMAEKLKRPLLFLKWEDYFDWQIADIREEFHMNQAPAKGHWDWTFDGRF